MRIIDVFSNYGTCLPDVIWDFSQVIDDSNRFTTGTTDRFQDPKLVWVFLSRYLKGIELVFQGVTLRMDVVFGCMLGSNSLDIFP